MNQTFQAVPSPSTAATTGPRGRVAIVSARWHRDIVEHATHAVRAQLDCAAASPIDVEEYVVPGAFEIPLHARRLAQTGRYDGIVACAFVVNGGIYRHEFVSAAVIDGLMRVQLDTDVPMFSAVLTPRDFHEHEEHREFFAKHFVKKGTEVARACMETLASLEALRAKAA